MERASSDTSVLAVNYVAVKKKKSQQIRRSSRKLIMHLQLFHLTCRRGHLHLGVQDGETAARRSCPGGHSALPDIRPATLLLRGSEGPGKLCPEPGEFPQPEGPPPPAPGPAPAPETGRAAIPLSPSGRQGAGLLSPGPSALQCRPDQAAGRTVPRRAFLHRGTGGKRKSGSCRRRVPALHGSNRRHGRRGPR